MLELHPSEKNSTLDIKAMYFQNTIPRKLKGCGVTKYGASMRSAPITTRLILTAMLYATAAVPLTWDQGMASTLPSVKGFQDYFKIDSGSNPAAIQNFVSLSFVGAGVGAALSFLINDRLGRLWSFRLYVLVYTAGQMIATGAPDVGTLYAARIVTGLGIGALTVTGPLSLAEISPKHLRGLLAAWFPVTMGFVRISIGKGIARDKCSTRRQAQTCAVFCVYGVALHLKPSPLQYRIVFFAPVIYLWVWIFISFFLSESPRWLAMVDRPDEAIHALQCLRGLPVNNQGFTAEVEDLLGSVQGEVGSTHRGYIIVIREAFTKRSNLRRIQQCLICYALPQLSGANAISSYFIPILEIIGVSGGVARSIFLTGMYNVARFMFALITSFLLIDALGRRRSLFLGILLQISGDIYLSCYLKAGNKDSRSEGQAALAMIFIHSFGYSAGLLTLPYVFGGELWNNTTRSFGAAFGQTFHWLFSYAMTYGLPSLLKNTDNWGAFVFFACWCSVAMCYVFFVVPEIAGLSMEEIEDVFKGSWFKAYQSPRKAALIRAESLDSGDKTAEADTIENIEQRCEGR